VFCTDFIFFSKYCQVFFLPREKCRIMKLRAFMQLNRWLNRRTEFFHRYQNDIKNDIIISDLGSRIIPTAREGSIKDT